MAGSVLGYPMAASSSGGRKRKRETPTGVWCMIYSNFSVQQMGPQTGRAVLQLHPALGMFYPGPVLASV